MNKVLLINKNQKDFEEFILKFDSINVNNNNIVSNFIFDDKIFETYYHKLNDDFYCLYFILPNQIPFQIFTDENKGTPILSIELILELQKKISLVKEDFIFAVHWGGINKDSLVEFNEGFNKQLLKEQITNFKFAYYSSTIDGIDNINNLNALKSIFLSQISGKELSKLDFKTYREKLIDLWLPLAIDIQGLSEVIKKNDGNAKEYWKEIKCSTSNFYSLLKEHNDIVQHNEGLQIVESEEISLLNFLNELDNNSIDKIPDCKYLNPDSNFFFPVWMQELLKKIDMIEKN